MKQTKGDFKIKIPGVIQFEATNLSFRQMIILVSYILLFVAAIGLFLHWLLPVTFRTFLHFIK